MSITEICNLLEAAMILCFGLSWPISIRKSWTARTAKGKSLFFEVFIWIGYIFGIANKFLQYSHDPNKGWIFFLAWAFYFLNITEITVDMILYFRNTKLDKAKEEVK
jgi:hypothetical protein